MANQDNSAGRDPNDPRNQTNRLHLNMGFQDRAFNPGEAGRAYPTTPSTFPQPVFPNQHGQQEIWGQQSSAGPYSGGQGYFFANQNQPSMQQQSNLAAPSATYRSPTAGGYTDVTNGLVHQFSHQNLNAQSPRAGSPYGRNNVAAAANAQRPRTAGAIGGSQYNSNFYAPPIPSQNGFSALQHDELPIRNAEKYSDNVYRRAKGSNEMIQIFFKDSVIRARERNQRAVDLGVLLRDPNVQEKRKEQKRTALRKSEMAYLRFLRTKENPNNFNTVKIIGKGAFGEVKLVQKKSDGKIYALKSLVKSEMYKRDQLAHVRSERDILAESESPWVVKLFTTFQDSTFLYMLMEFLPGGDLMTMLIKYEIFSEDITRFYMAELVLAIEAVHKLGFIHRDIKPDNILLDRGGHIKLTDFGLSTGFHRAHDAQYYQDLMHGKPKPKRDNRQSVSIDQIQLTVSNRGQINTWRKSRRQLAYSTVGTPDYIAPEIFTGKGYDFGCDWWSVGTIMFECLIGWPPFCAEDSNETYRKIVDWPRHLHFPPDQKLNRDPEDFVRRLICYPEDRLGRVGGGAEIKSHDFFRGVDWTSLRKIRAPFEPKLTSNIDTQYFPIDEIPQQDTSAQIRAREAGNEDAAEMSLPFIGYTYKRFDAFRGQN